MERAIQAIDLLRLEMDTLWGADRYGRPARPHPFVVIAVADDGWDVRFAPEVPSDLRRTLDGMVGNVGPGAPSLEAYRESLAPRGPASWCGWSGYAFPKALSVPSPLEVLTSEGAEPTALERPEPWWEPGEWADLIAGRLGPWAFGIEGRRVVAVCHTPVASQTGAEAGVWTHPERRGRGYAGAVTAAWARVARREFGALFYSAAVENAASNAVARKLGLRPVGKIWQLRADA